MKYLNPFPLHFFTSEFSWPSQKRNYNLCTALQWKCCHRNKILWWWSSGVNIEGTAFLYLIKLFIPSSSLQFLQMVIIYIFYWPCMCTCIYLILVCCIYLVVYRAWATFVLSCLCIYICTVFHSVVEHSLLLSSLLLVNYKYLYFWGKLYLFVSLKHIPFCIFFFCSLKYLASPFLFIIRFFLFVISSLVINLYIVSD